MSDKNNYKNGAEVVRNFCDQLLTNTDLQEIIKKEFNIKGELVGSTSNEEHSKNDAIIEFDDGTSIGISIKSFSNKKSSFNQITRCRPKNFCEIFFDADETIYDKLKKRLLAKARRPKKSDNVKTFNEEFRILFESKIHDIIPWALTKNADTKLLGIYDKSTSKMYIYAFTNILKNLSYTTTLSEKGVIKIGELFSIQRKSGDGNVKGSKTKIEHPSNDIQVKFDPFSFIESMNSHLLTSFKMPIST